MPSQVTRPAGKKRQGQGVRKLGPAPPLETMQGDLRWATLPPGTQFPSCITWKLAGEGCGPFHNGAEVTLCTRARLGDVH